MIHKKWWNTMGDQTTGHEIFQKDIIPRSQVV